MVNEALCKILCHNLCVLIQERHELGIDAEFSLSGYKFRVPRLSRKTGA